MALDRGSLLTFCLHRSFPPTILDETITKLTCQTCTYHPIICLPIGASRGGKSLPLARPDC